MDFADESFDLIISRNVAWTIINAEKAYNEWKRLLKPDGRILIFDANWNIRLFDEKKNEEHLRDLAEVRRLYPDFEFAVHSDCMDDFRRSMPMCARVRPQWDFDTLLSVGFKKVACNTDISRLIHEKPEQLLYRATPMFMLIAEK